MKVQALLFGPGPHRLCVKLLSRKKKINSALAPDWAVIFLECMETLGGERKEERKKMIQERDIQYVALALG